MQIELIDQDILDEENTVMTKVVISQVDSQCILARLMMQALGRPGLDTDLNFFGSGGQWTAMWTYPVLTLEATETLVNMVIQRT